MASPAPEVFATEAAQTMVDDGNGGAPVHVEPELWGLAPFQIVSISMLVLLLFAFFGAKVHKSLGAGIDGKIAASQRASKISRGSYCQTLKRSPRK